MRIGSTPPAVVCCCSSNRPACSARRPRLVIDRVLALPAAEIDRRSSKWLILMVLFRQPGQEDACAAIEDLLFDDFGAWLH